MRLILSPGRLPHSHIDPDWLSGLKRESSTKPRKFQERASKTMFSARRIAPVKSASVYLVRSSHVQERKRMAPVIGSVSVTFSRA
jgi:hypothetical protein